MDFVMEASIFLTYAIVLLLLCFFGKLLIFPVKILFKLLLNSIVGGILLLIINAIGGNIDIFLPLNIITVLVAGMLGVPV